MAQYRINDTTLTNIADAIRNKTGELTKIAEVPMDAPAIYDITLATNEVIDNKLDMPIVNNVGRVVIVIKPTDIGEAVATTWAVFNQDTRLADLLMNSRKWKTHTVDKTFNGETVKLRFVSGASGGYKVNMTVEYYDVSGNLITTQEAEVLNTMTPEQMADEINGIEIPEKIPEEAFTITGNCDYQFSHNGWNWFINEYGNKIKTSDIISANHMFYNNIEITSIPFEVNMRNNSVITNMFDNCSYLETAPKINGEVSNMCSYLFQNCQKLKTISDITISPTASYADCVSIFSNCFELENLPYLYNLYPSSIQNLFSYCYKLKTIPEDYFDTWNFNRINTYAYSNISGIFTACYSLRSVSPNILSKLRNDAATSVYTKIYYYLFRYCYTIDEIVGIPIDEASLTSNAFNYAFQGCVRAKNLLFETNEDGTPKTAKWKNQTIDLSGTIGWCGAGDTSLQMIKQYNPDVFTDDKLISDDATYQVLKDDPDCIAVNVAYSRYNHDSAVATINSLPDCSAYGTNTIKFKGTAGELTDGGAINTLTEEEIAVATAKGWTVTLA